MAPSDQSPEPSPVDLDAELAREAARAAKAELAARYEADDLKWLMSQKRGRRLMWRLLDHAGVYRLSFAQGAEDRTAFNEGQRNVGLRLLTILHEHCGEDYASMVQERSNG